MADNQKEFKTQVSYPPDPPQGPTPAQPGQQLSPQDTLRVGGNQFNPIPQEQQYAPLPRSVYITNTPPTAQPPIPNQIVTKSPSDKFWLKLILLIVALFTLVLVVIAATLHYTEYFIYEPPQPIINLIESVFAKLAKFNINLELPDLPFISPPTSPPTPGVG